MFLRIDPASSVPIYRQLVDQVVDRLASRELVDGDRLPSIRSISTALRINPNTVIKAYRELEHLGFAVSRHGKGFFVTGAGLDPARRQWRDRALDSLASAVRRAVSVGVTPAVIHDVVEMALLEGEKNEK